MKKIHKKAAALVFAAAMAGLPMGTALGSLGTMTVWAEEAEGAKAPSETQEEMQTETQEETVAETTAEQPEVQITFPGRRYKKYRRFFHCKSGSQNF